MTRITSSRRSIRTAFRRLSYSLTTSAAIALMAGPAAPQTLTTYAYDALGRVISAVYPDGSAVSYQYDAAGNRTQANKVSGAPSAGPASLTVAYNTAGTVALTPSGNYNSLAIASVPAHGTATISGTSATYSPAAGYYGADSFTYIVTGPGGTSTPATVNVTVSNPAAPSAGNVSLVAGYNTQGLATLAPSGVYTLLNLLTLPAHGTASITGTSATYTPNSGYYGPDSFSYTSTGPGGTSAPAMVNVSVAAPPPPSAGNGSLTVAYNTPGSVALSPSGVYTSMSVSSAPTHGTVSISGTTANYTPAVGYSGPDSFSYAATGPGGTSPPAIVNITVQAPANISPVCTNWTITLNIPAPPYGTNSTTVNVPASAFLSHCSDSDGGTLSVTSPAMPLATQITRGQTLNFPYTVSDGQGGSGSAVLTIKF